MQHCNLRTENRWRELRRELVLGLALMAGVIAAPAAMAQTFTVLHNFSGGANGEDPTGGVIRDSAGNLYGTASRTAKIGECGPHPCCLVFQLARTGAETALHVFQQGADNGIPTQA